MLWNKKIASILYLPNLAILNKNKSVTSFKTLQNGGVDPNGIPKKRPTLCKTWHNSTNLAKLIFISTMALAMHFLGFLVSLSTFINCIVQTFKLCDCQGKVNQGLKSQTPPYLPNGDSVKEFFYIIGFRTLENGGVGHFQISKR